MSELPEGWVETTLGDVADVKLGRQRSPKNHYGPNMRPYLRAANVTWNGLDLGDVNEMHFSEEECARFELRGGDVLVAEASGSASEVGKPAIWRGAIAGCCFQNTLLRVRSLGPLPEFLYAVLRSDARAGRLGHASRGVGIHHIGAQRLTAWTIPLPPLPEQERIVAAIEEQFSRLDAAEESLRRARRNLGRVRRALISRALAGAWPLVELSKVTHEQGYGSSAKATSDPKGGVPVLRMGNIVEGQLDFRNLKYLASDHPDVAKYSLERGDLLFNRTNSPELVGKSAVFKNGPAPMIFASYLIRVRLSDDCDPDWAALSINGPGGREYIASVRTQQVGQANVNGTKLAAFPMPLPPLDEQLRIVAELEAQLSLIDAQAVAIDTAQKRASTLRRAILERAFTGKLVPQDPNDEPASVLLGRIRTERAVAEPLKRRKQAARS